MRIPVSSDTYYFDKALAIQKEKIERQTKELRNLRAINVRDIETSDISEAVRFLVKVINCKIKKYARRVHND